MDPILTHVIAGVAGIFVALVLSAMLWKITR